MVKPKTDDKALQRQKDYNARRKAEGWKRVCVLVPPAYVDAVEKEVNRIRRKWQKEMGN